MNTQVSQEHYTFSKYVSQERMLSYWHQIKECLSLDPQSVLEIGSGDMIFGNYLRSNTDITYKNMDIAEDLHPAYIGSVDNITIDETFDMVCAFEVLEHLPYEKFELCLQNLAKVSRSHVLLSLPHFGPYFKLSLRLPFFGHKEFFFKTSFFTPKHVFDGEHYWEIGKQDYPLSRVETDISRTLTIEKSFVLKEHPYHHFFVCKVR